MKHPVKSVVLGLSLLFVSSSAAYAQDYYNGLEAEMKGDFAAALKEWLPLAAQGNAKAQFELGLMYSKGKGVTQDYKEAARWYRLAAKQGLAIAQNFLGSMYSDGQGVTQDYKEAAKWYRLSAAQGNGFSQFNLGVMYANGQGVIQDDVYAHMWFNVLASVGNTGAGQNRDSIAKRMTAADISKAQDLARACVQKNYKGC